jgi:DNA-binding NtrC family response regulator
LQGATQVYSAPIEVLKVSAPSNGIVPLAELEKETALRALGQLNGDKILGARMLRIGKTTLYRKLKEYESQT